MADLRRVFSITELDRKGAAVKEGGLPLRFEWDIQSQTAPMGEWSFGVELRTVREDYAGADEPVEQVLGWNYTDFSLHGKWDDRYAGSGFAVTTWRAFEAMVKRGPMVQIEFESVTIQGLIKAATFRYRREAFIEYEFEVSPHYRHRGDSGRERLIPPFASDPTQILTDAQAQTLKLTVALANVRRQHVDAFADVESVVDTVSTLDQAYAAINEARIEIEEGTELDVPVMRRLSQAIGAVRAAHFDAALAVGALSAEANTLLRRPLAKLGFESWSRGVGIEARLGVVKSYDAQRALSSRAQPDAKAVYRPYDGEHVYSISQRFYGTIRGWRQILEANGLNSPVMTGTELLVIPEIETAT